MFCGKCGKEIKVRANYCPCCGAKINTEVDPIPATQPVPATSNEGKATPRVRRKTLPLVVAICCLVLLPLILGIVAAIKPSKKQTNFEKIFEKQELSGYGFALPDPGRLELDTNPADELYVWNGAYDITLVEYSMNQSRYKRGLEGINIVNKALEFPDTLYDEMSQTTEKTGRRTEETETYRVSWINLPEIGLEVVYELKARSSDNVTTNPEEREVSTSRSLSTEEPAQGKDASALEEPENTLTPAEREIPARVPVYFWMMGRQGFRKVLEQSSDMSSWLADFDGDWQEELFLCRWEDPYDFVYEVWQAGTEYGHDESIDYPYFEATRLTRDIVGCCFASIQERDGRCYLALGFTEGTELWTLEDGIWIMAERLDSYMDPETEEKFYLINGERVDESAYLAHYDEYSDCYHMGSGWMPEINNVYETLLP